MNNAADQDRVIGVESGPCVRVVGENDDAGSCTTKKYGLAEVEWCACAGASTRLSMWRAKCYARDGSSMEVLMSSAELSQYTTHAMGKSGT